MPSRFPARGTPTRRVAAGSLVTVVADPGAAGEIELTGFGLRTGADALVPARFDVLARATDVVFHPPSGRARVLGRIAVRPRPRGG